MEGKRWAKVAIPLELKRLAASIVKTKKTSAVSIDEFVRSAVDKKTREDVAYLRTLGIFDPPEGLKSSRDEVQENSPMLISLSFPALDHLTG